jgi:hypothetical protein
MKWHGLLGDFGLSGGSAMPATGIGVLLGGSAGLLIGGIIGNVSRFDRWRPVAIKDHPISVAPRLDALGFTMTVAF